MWIFIEKEHSCINLDHVSRLYVETTGSGAALKADLNGKTMMVSYSETKEAARATLSEILVAREAGQAVFRLTKS